jgi:UDP-N-acetylmuramoyl-L-alanyl-D-glutamate--2,6-diaminopimelate ligase
MTLGELFGLEAKLPEGLSRVPITGLAADSREVKPGYLFAALPGVKTDGTRFIAQALERGAAAILMPRGAKGATNSAAIIEDSDPRRRLALIAALRPAQDRRRRHWHQRQTSVASSCGSWRGRVQGGKPRHGRCARPAPRSSHTTPDPIDSHPCRLVRG